VPHCGSTPALFSGGFVLNYQPETLQFVKTVNVLVFMTTTLT
jgi:hypothetical protein